MAQYYRQFIQDFLKIVRPLFNLINTDMEYEWNKPLIAIVMNKEFGFKNNLSAQLKFSLPLRKQLSFKTESGLYGFKSSKQTIYLTISSI